MRETADGDFLYRMLFEMLAPLYLSTLDKDRLLNDITDSLRDDLSTELPVVIFGYLIDNYGRLRGKI